MPYQVDIWAGDLHQNHIGAKQFDGWGAAADFIAPLIDAGLLCNVLHTDFRAPEERMAEADAALAKYLQE